MVSSTKNSSAAEFLAASANSPSSTSKTRSIKGFEDQLASAIRQALENAGLDPDLVEVSGGSVDGQSSVSPASSRQFVVTVKEPATAAQPAAASNDPVANLTTAATASAARDPKETLASALRSAGLDASQYPMSLWSQTVAYPGGQFLQAGSYVNNFITVDLGARGKFDFSSDLMMRNPQVTVNEIKTLLDA